MRLDILLVERDLAESRALAQRLIMAGQVRVDGQIFLKPSTAVPVDVQLAVDEGPRFVSRGGEKLAAALHCFALDVNGTVCADVGASTGGFTNCLLQNGAIKVYAIDVGQGILHWKLRQDSRVIVMEKANARYLEQLPEPVDLITIDASFISLKVLLPVVNRWLRAATAGSTQPVAGNVIALVKPQFEAGRAQVARGDGVIRDPEIHRQVLENVLAFAVQQGYEARDLIRSPLLGPKGNMEFLAWRESPAGQETDIPALVKTALL